MTFNQSSEIYNDLYVLLQAMSCTKRVIDVCGKCHNTASSGWRTRPEYGSLFVELTLAARGVAVSEETIHD